VWRRSARAVYRAAIRRSAKRHRSAPTANEAMVFAPHPDDETLGCGGTIVLKRRLGAQVTIVAMTDGAAASGADAEGAGLKAVRQVELLEAARVLGVPAERLIFLEYPDGRLRDFRQDATDRVRALIESLRPVEIFVPYRHDGHPDHEATSEIVHAALRSLVGRFRVLVFEYPVWFLYHWPLVDAPVNGRIPLLSTLRSSGLRAARVFREFQANCDVSGVLDVKRDALERHRSQLTGSPSHPQWRSLAALSDGEFLELFLGDDELFHRADSSPSPAPRHR
jgi:LmbE family N-acetylglucosaminyl deacetylase